MKKVESDCFDVEYNECDESYINSVIDILQNDQKRIMDFFKLTKLDKKVTIKFWDNLDVYREHFNQMLKPYGQVVQDWESARATNAPNESNINIVSYLERLKCQGHSHDEVEQITKTVIHEFVHVCHAQYNNHYNSLVWFSEALATILADQYKDLEPVFTCNLDELLHKPLNYRNYQFLGKYVLEFYDHDYVLELARNNELLINETPKLFNEAKEMFNNLNDNKTL